MSRAKTPVKKQPYVAVIAIDPAKCAGIGIIVAGKVAASRPASGDRWVFLYPALKQAWEDAGAPTGRVLGVIEGGWLNRGGKGAHTLAMRRGIAQAALEALGVTDIEFIGPSTWQNAYFGSIHKQDTKELSMAAARIVLGREPSTDDEADALNLGIWAWREYCTDA